MLVAIRDGAEGTGPRAARPAMMAGTLGGFAALSPDAFSLGDIFVTFP